MYYYGRPLLGNPSGLNDIYAKLYNTSNVAQGPFATPQAAQAAAANSALNKARASAQIPFDPASAAADIHTSLNSMGVKGVGVTNNTAPKRGLGGLSDRLMRGVDKAAGVAENAIANTVEGRGIAPKYANLAKFAMGADAAVKGIKGISDYNAAQTTTQDLVSDILASAGSNPNLRYALSADQLQTLRQLQNGSYDLTGDFDIDSILGNLGKIATGAGLGYITGGGPWGAVLGGLGSAIEGVSSGMVGNQNQITADLEGLYQALYEAEMQNKSMRRDAAMQRYVGGLY